MHRIVDESYGADADGNRSIVAVFYELEKSDTPEIESQITEFIQSSGELPSNPFTVQLIDPINEHDVAFDINPFDYLSNEQMVHILTTYED